MPVKLSITKTSTPTIGKVYLGSLPIGKIYLGDKLIFNGEQWLYCLVTSELLYLETSDGFKLRPYMEE